ncbi:uncharacterized protein Jhbp16 [Neodiprion pinetum]|uniref:uncharacterized protein Jhbp16 n=1 Tax=Neodiprion pinetum TaxID=441929 RepID=UPI001EDD6391|nr:uncharacterized protein LOC124216663 [Neodiprion pinetum]
MQLQILIIGGLLPFWAAGQAEKFEDNFANCRVGQAGFDACVREGLNAVRPFFKTGLPQYNVAPFDPFFAQEVTASRGVPALGFTLTLRNVTETGWSASKVTRFVSDLSNYRVQYTQSFPEKYLAGDYEFKAQIFNTKIANKGKFTLTLYDLVQTTMITRQPNSKLTASIDVEKISNLELHITNLLQGRQLIETVLDRIINTMWQPGFVVTRGLINELVSTAFTEIFGKAFQDFPFEKLFKSKSKDV